jgi:hypothetical protein
MVGLPACMPKAATVFAVWVLVPFSGGIACLPPFCPESIWGCGLFSAVFCVGFALVGAEGMGVDFLGPGVEVPDGLCWFGIWEGLLGGGESWAEEFLTELLSDWRGLVILGRNLVLERLEVIWV